MSVEGRGGTYRCEGVGGTHWPALINSKIALLGGLSSKGANRCIAIIICSSQGHELTEVRWALQIRGAGIVKYGGFEHEIYAGDGWKDFVSVYGC